jgi:integrase
MARRSTPGVLYRHSRGCKGRDLCSNNCNASPEPWEAWVFDPKYVDPNTGQRVGKKIRRRFSTHAAAKGWRHDAAGQVRRRTLRAVAPRTVNEEIDEWLEGARSGSILNKRREAYKPAVIRNYELALRLRVRPALGHRRLDSIEFSDLLALQEQLQGAGCSASVIRNSFVPVQAILRRARRRGVIATNPALDLELPSAASRERAATPDQAAELLTTLDDREAAIWATGFYAGLRRGEIRALRAGDVDLEASTITVERGWDEKEGPVAPKSRAGRRTVFLLDALRLYLEPFVASRGVEDLVFGSGAEVPFDARALARKAERMWDTIDKARRDGAEEAGNGEWTALERFTLHEARHSFSTWMDHAGISPDRADRYMGHSSGNVASRYRHLLASQRGEDRQRLDAYLTGSAEGKVVALSSVPARAAATPAVVASS